MRDDFAVLIITHARPETQPTQETLKKIGYTGKVLLVMDDEDTTREQYIQKYGEENIRLFNKDDVLFDTMDNFYQQKGVSSIARNACWKIAEQEGLRYFLMLDDDYPNIVMRYSHDGKLKNKQIKNFDAVIEAFIKFLMIEPIHCISFAVDGDFIGGAKGKASKGIWQGGRNSFLCDTRKSFEFKGRIMEDLTTPVFHNHFGKLFFTVGAIEVLQTAERLRGGYIRLLRGHKQVCPIHLQLNSYAIFSKNDDAKRGLGSKDCKKQCVS